MKLNMKKNYSKQNGITLIALIVTIVILLILAGVTLNAVFSDNGIIKMARDAQTKTDQGMQKDLEPMGELEDLINKNAGENKSGETVKISTIVGKGAVTQNTKAVDAYENKITIPKGFKVLSHNPTSSTGAVTYTYNEDNTPAVQDGIVIENETDGNQFVWVPVGTINNKAGDSRGTTSTITLGRYSDFTAKNGVYTPAQSAEKYTQETIITANVKNKSYTIAKLDLGDGKENTIKINKAIQLDGTTNNSMAIKTADVGPSENPCDYRELNSFREGNSKIDSTAENATARDLKTFIETSLANGGYYIARFEASGTKSKITSKYNQTVLGDITQPDAAKVAREMYGEEKENNKLIYASDLANSYAWDTTIIFIQTYGTEKDASSYAIQNKSTLYAKTGINNDKYCNIWDMSGNAREWTTENSTQAVDNPTGFVPCVTRGGYYLSYGEGSLTSSRQAFDTTNSFSYYGLRPILYVK